MFSLFKKKTPQPDLSAAPSDFSFLGADMHSHLVPGIDDGAPDVETSLMLIRRMKELGFSKLITTPHVFLEFYDNNAEKITAHFDKLKRFIDDHRLGVELDVAAEYYLDNLFLSAVLPDGLLSFGKKCVLVEVSMAGWPRQFNDMIFSIQADGYVPVLAHIERYLFEEDVRVYQQLKDKGVLMQMNLLSITGYYGKGVKMLAEKYLDHQLYDFCGTDMHHARHADHLSKLAKGNPDLMTRLAGYSHWRNSSLL
jgi:tyrosine-protein phosphatase YwqE